MSAYSLEQTKIVKRHHLRRTKLNDDNIDLLKDKMGWQGKGTLEEPIIIDNIHGLKPNLSFHLKIKHVIIKDVSVFNITCSNSQNITIKNCKIITLLLQRCQNIAIKKNSIIILKSAFSKACFIENNTVSQEAMLAIENNSHDNFIVKARPILISIFFLFAALAPYILASDIRYWWISLMFIGVDVIIVGLIFYWEKMRKKIKHLAPHTIKNNALSYDMSTTFKEILGDFQHLKSNWFFYYLPYILTILIGSTIAVLSWYIAHL